MQVERGQEFVEDLGINPPSDIAGERVTALETLDSTKLLLGDESWLLFRQSGTEPVLRIYSEATSAARVDMLLTAGGLLPFQP